MSIANILELLCLIGNNRSYKNCIETDNNLKIKSIYT